MFRQAFTASRRRLVLRQCVPTSTLTTSQSARLNSPLNLDPSLKSLMKDGDISLMSKKHQVAPQIRHELEAIHPEVTGGESLEEWQSEEEELSNSRDSRKSPAAEFGSYRIGAVVLPHELVQSIDRIIAGNNAFRYNYAI
jgi:hypothetical protein